MPIGQVPPPGNSRDKVSFSPDSRSFDVKNNTLTLHGTSLNFEILSSQGKTIEEINQVSQIIFDDIRTNDKGIDFEMSIILTPNFFKE